MEPSLAMAAAMVKAPASFASSICMWPVSVMSCRRNPKHPTDIQGTVATTRPPKASTGCRARFRQQVQNKVSLRRSGVRASLGQLAGRALQNRPGLVAVLALPLSVEARLAKLVAKPSRVSLVEGHALPGEFLLKRGIQLSDVFALFLTRSIDVLGHDVAQVLRQALPRATVRQKPETVPHVICQRAVFLHLVELCGRDDRERVFLLADDSGLQRGIDFVEVDGGR